MVLLVGARKISLRCAEERNIRKWFTSPQEPVFFILSNEIAAKVCGISMFCRKIAYSLRMGLALHAKNFLKTPQ